MGVGINFRLRAGVVAIVALAGLLAGGAVAAHAAGFDQAAGSPVSVSGATGAIALGDLNRDGNLDAVVADPTAGKVDLLLGDGRGGLTAAGSVATGGSKPSAVALADLNGDGTLDAAVTNETSHNVSLLLGNGAGGLAPAPKSPFLTDSARPVSIVTGDFNGDGRTDVAVANFSSADVSVLVSDGAGGLTLTGPPVETGGDHSGPLAAGDFNGDGKLDLAVGNGSGQISVLLGNGAGGLKGAAGSPFGLSPAAIGAGDFNGDGKLDVAVANKTGTISLLAGSGTGALTPFPPGSAPLAAGVAPSSMVVTDLDRDGNLDLAVANAGTGDLSVLSGNGAAGFTPAVGTPVSTGGSSPSSLAAGDMNGDGKLDLVAVNAASASVSVLLNDVALPLASFASFPASPIAGQQVTFVYSSAGAISAIDWDLNGDGVYDDAHGPSASRAFPAPGVYQVGLRVTDVDGLVSSSRRTIAVVSAAGPPGAAAPVGLRLISPFPIVRISGKTSIRGAHITRLEVLAPSGAKVTVSCDGRGCPFRKWRKAANGRTLSVKPLRGRFLPVGVTLEVRVYKEGQIGKYTRIRIHGLRPPTRKDLCLAPGSSAASRCPAA